MFVASLKHIVTSSKQFVAKRRTGFREPHTGYGEPRDGCCDKEIDCRDTCAITSMKPTYVTEYIALSASKKPCVATKMTNFVANPTTATCINTRVVMNPTYVAANPPSQHLKTHVP